MSTQSQIDQWNAAVEKIAARDGISFADAADNLAALLNSDAVQDAIRTEVYSRLETLEGRLETLEANLGFGRTDITAPGRPDPV
jgi:hypothetical protein